MPFNGLGFKFQAYERNGLMFAFVLTIDNTGTEGLVGLRGGEVNRIALGLYEISIPGTGDYPTMVATATPGTTGPLTVTLRHTLPGSLLEVRTFDPAGNPVDIPNNENVKIHVYATKSQL